MFQLTSLLLFFYGLLYINKEKKKAGQPFYPCKMVKKLNGINYTKNEFASLKQTKITVMCIAFYDDFRLKRQIFKNSLLLI